MRIKLIKKYRFLTLDRVVVRSLLLNVAFIAKWIRLQMNGTLFIEKYYAWDGPSFPAIRTRNFLIPSLVHDCFYQAMREGYLVRSKRKDVDRELRRMCLEYGMHKVRAWYVYHFVRLFGKKHSKPRKNPWGKILEVTIR